MAIKLGERSEFGRIYRKPLDAMLAYDEILTKSMVAFEYDATPEDPDEAAAYIKNIYTAYHKYVWKKYSGKVSRELVIAPWELVKNFRYNGILAQLMKSYVDFMNLRYDKENDSYVVSDIKMFTLFVATPLNPEALMVHKKTVQLLQQLDYDDDKDDLEHTFTGMNKLSSKSLLFSLFRYCGADVDIVKNAMYIIKDHVAEEGNEDKKTFYTLNVSFHGEFNPGETYLKDRKYESENGDELWYVDIALPWSSATSISMKFDVTVRGPGGFEKSYPYTIMTVNTTLNYPEIFSFPVICSEGQYDFTGYRKIFDDFVDKYITCCRLYNKETSITPDPMMVKMNTKEFMDVFFNSDSDDCIPLLFNEMSNEDMYFGNLAASDLFDPMTYSRYYDELDDDMPDFDLEDAEDIDDD